MIEMTIDSIRVSMMNYQRVVILKEKADGRYLPIWIGPAEADAIAVKLHDISVSRPMTHDLLQSVITRLGAIVNSIIVTDLINDTFYARIILEVSGECLEIDSRPSDALALAVRVDVPIYAEESVLDRAAITIDHETGKPVLPSMDDGEDRIDDEELDRLSAFRDFINSLDLEDLGRGGS